MNISRGLFRTWIFISVIWLIGVCVFAYVVSPFEIAGSRWGYEHRMRTNTPPWKVDWSTPYYETMYSRSKEGVKPSFHRLEYRYVDEWDKSVKDGTMVLVDMPDKSSLYLYVAMTKEDQQYLARAFWDQRWGRYLDIGKPWLAGLVGPPLALLVLGWSLLWVGRGFAK